jgi:uncharacterized protein YkwD
MSQGSGRGLLVWVLVLASGCTTAASPSEMPAAGTASGITASIVDLTNAERSDAGVVPLRASSQLMQAAQLHAEQMARTGQMSHEIAGVRYPAPPDRLAAVGYRWGSYGENIAMGQTSATAVMASWMRSSGHRGNILNGRYREIGVGYARDSAGRPYFVQVFATPL